MADSLLPKHGMLERLFGQEIDALNNQASTSMLARTPVDANAWRRKYQCAIRLFGVPVALITDVASAPMKSVSRGRKACVRARHNRLFFNDLGSRAAGAKRTHYFHRYAQGEKVKSFVPAKHRPQNGRPPVVRRNSKAHLNLVEGNEVY